MGYFDYSREPKSDIAFVDMKSFYASVECVERGLHPLKTSLCVMSRADNSNGLILASSPMFKKVFGKQNVGRVYDLPFDIHTRKFSYYNAKRQGIEIITPEYVQFVEEWAKRLHNFHGGFTHYRNYRAKKESLDSFFIFLKYLKQLILVCPMQSFLLK